MAASVLFSSSDPALARRTAAALQRAPELRGAPIRVETARGLRDRRGAVHGGSFLRKRRIALDCTRSEFPRVVVHEVAHFVWLRLGNRRRQSWEILLAAEFAARARGELGWSAEWRKRALPAAALGNRTRAWREYCCESFCDTAAWLWSGVARHPEFTLGARLCARRRRWFEAALGNGPISI